MWVCFLLVGQSIKSWRWFVCRLFYTRSFASLRMTIESDYSLDILYCTNYLCYCFYRFSSCCDVWRKGMGCYSFSLTALWTVLTLTPNWFAVCWRVCHFHQYSMIAIMVSSGICFLPGLIQLCGQYALVSSQNNFTFHLLTCGVDKPNFVAISVWLPQCSNI